MGIIRVNNIKVYAHHGCMNEEATIGGRYVINVAVTGDFSHAENSDELIDTVDYVTVREIVEKEMAQRSKLIESVCRRMSNALMETFPQLSKTWVQIIKVSPPIDGDVDSVSYEIENER